jgi:hypothetical protein
VGLPVAQQVVKPRGVGALERHPLPPIPVTPQATSPERLLKVL